MQYVCCFFYQFWCRYRLRYRPGSGTEPNKIAVEYIANNSGKSLRFTYKKDATNLGLGTIPKISDYFRETQLELDYEQGVDRWLNFDTNSLPRPADVAAETLTLEKIYGRAGIEITRSDEVNAVSGAGARVIN